MTYVVEYIKPEPDSQYLLKACDCGSNEAVYLQCKDPLGNLSWRVKCLRCNAHTESSFPIRHDAQIAWNTGQHIIKP